MVSLIIIIPTKYKLFHAEKYARIFVRDSTGKYAWNFKINQVSSHFGPEIDAVASLKVEGK
jgi:hypothetical protein